MQWLVSDDPVRARKGHGAFDDVFGTQSAIGSIPRCAGRPLARDAIGGAAPLAALAFELIADTTPPVTITGAALVRENGLGPFFG